MMENNNYFVNRILRKYLFPTILTILGTTLLSFANSMIVGKALGKDALAVINIVSTFTFLFAMLGCLINIGASSEASLAIGRQDYDRVKDISTYALITSIIVPMLVSVLCLVFFRQFMRFLGADERLYGISVGYAYIMIAFGFLTTLMYFVFNFLRLDGRTIYATVIFSSMTVIDIMLVLLFLKEDLELFGVGLAVVISTALADGIGMFYLFRKKDGYVHLCKLKSGDIKRISFGVLKRGTSSGLNNFCNMLRTMVLNALIIKCFGSDSMGVFAAVCAVVNLTSATIMGGGQTIAPLAGVFYGEKDVQSLKMLIKSAEINVMVIHGIICLIGIPLSRLIAQAFGFYEEQLISDAAWAISLFLLSLIPAAVLNIYIYYYSTIGKTFFSCMLVFLRSFALVAGFAKIAAAYGWERMFYLSFPAAEIICCMIIFIVGKLSNRQALYQMGTLYIREIPKENYVSFSVNTTTEGAVEASEKMLEFCKENEIDKKYRTFLPMAIEELLVIINEHCFKEEKGEYIDVRIYLDDDGVLLRVRCNGSIFDPIAWYRKKSENMDEIEMMMDEALGMKMILASAKSVSYQNTFGMNNLVVVI